MEYFATEWVGKIRIFLTLLYPKQILSDNFLAKKLMHGDTFAIIEVISVFIDFVFSNLELSLQILRLQSFLQKILRD